MNSHADTSARTITGSANSRLIGVACGFSALLLALRLALVGALETVYYLSGWFTFALAACLALTWLWRDPGPQLAKRLERHLAFSLPLVIAFWIHTDFRIPNGLLDQILTAWLALSVASLFLGRWLLAMNSPHLRVWLGAHVAVNYSLVSLAVWHGIHVHAHGLIAGRFFSA